MSFLLIIKIEDCATILLLKKYGKESKLKK